MLMLQPTSRSNGGAEPQDRATQCQLGCCSSARIPDLAGSIDMEVGSQGGNDHPLNDQASERHQQDLELRPGPAQQPSGKPGRCTHANIDCRIREAEAPTQRSQQQCLGLLLVAGNRPCQ